jgi:DNA-binding IclR family transcriptional regulator
MPIVPPSDLTPSLEGSSPATGGVAAVDRALCVLLALADGNGNLSLSEIAQRTGLYKSTVLRLLASLAQAHLVTRQPDGRHVLGPAVAKLHATYMRSFSYVDRVIATLHELVKTTRESAAFFVRQGEYRVCLRRIPSPHAVRDSIETGDLLPLGRGAAGRVLQAYDNTGDRAIGRRIRREQVVLLCGDRDPELAGIAAPVFGPLGEVLGAIALIIPSERVQHSWVTPVREAARALSLQLGGQFPPDISNG